MNIRAIIEESLQTAADLPDEGEFPGLVHRNRSKHFVEELASSMRREFSAQPTVRVFSKHYWENRRDFELNELLYDILVCETDRTKSPKHIFITRALWTIESELAPGTHQAVFDFNKLILSASDNKLFVGSQDPKIPNEELLDTLLFPACQCAGNVFIARIPHPNKWQVRPFTMDLWQLVARRWRDE